MKGLAIFAHLGWLDFGFGFGLVAETTGGVAPLGWLFASTILTDVALNDYDINWAAADYPYAVFPTTFDELIAATNAKRMVVGD